MTGLHRTRLFGWLVRHWLCTYLLMGLGFVIFGAASLNLVQVFVANFNFLAEYGLTAAADGALLQLFYLLMSAYAAVAFYLLFKTCEHALIERLAHFDPADPHP